MKKFFYILLITIISLVLSAKLKNKKTRCMAKGENCDFTAYCCQDYECKDYRCANKGTKDNQVEWGIKCDWFHHCADHYNCRSHRCVIDEDYVASELEKTLNGNE